MRRRKEAKSAVAGIVDAKGGLRIVITQPWLMRHHVGDGEQLFVVPGLEVQEPVPFGALQWLSVMVEDHIRAVRK